MSFAAGKVGGIGVLSLLCAVRSHQSDLSVVCSFAPPLLMFCLAVLFAAAFVTCSSPAVRGLLPLLWGFLLVGSLSRNDCGGVFPLFCVFPWSALVTVAVGPRVTMVPSFSQLIGESGVPLVVCSALVVIISVSSVFV